MSTAAALHIYLLLYERRQSWLNLLQDDPLPCVLTKAGVTQDRLLRRRSPSSSSLPPVEKASVAAGEISTVVGIQTYNIWIAAIWLLFQSFLKVNTTFKQINKHQNNNGRSICHPQHRCCTTTLVTSAQALFVLLRRVDGGKSSERRGAQ